MVPFGMANLAPRADGLFRARSLSAESLLRAQ